jgi:tetratricopeptide (TPR) repeat protein
VASSKEGLSSLSQGAIFDAEELFALARLDLKKGNVSEALEKLKAATRDEHPPAGAYAVCGHVYLQLELPGRAEQMFLKHLELYPGAPDEMFALGSVHYQTGRSAEALKLWDELLQQFPSYTPALLYRAILRAQAGQVAAARNDLEMLMKSTPVESPYFKPAKELLERLDAQRAAIAAGAAAAPYAGPPLEKTAYGSPQE